ncbi:helix-turn-helix domain-containing protein [Tardiphaga sp. P9-11]|uniref:helix-turn-helix domain-containing protein n=1 Tax=Tardiphaga sp. P9-11 TaxID=2024614 RepID=UPI0015629779|nr:helix-turn-helix domain-containing protein [Tardiphaga sp. P9-11]
MTATDVCEGAELKSKRIILRLIHLCYRSHNARHGEPEEGHSIIPDDLFLSTDMIETSLRTEVWREITRPYFETTQSVDDSVSTLEGSVRVRTAGTLLIGPTSFNRQHYSRDRRIIRQSGLDQYLIQLFVAGALEGDCGGQAISVKPGDICVFDLARTFTSSACAGSTMSITLPREQIDKAASGRSLHGVVLKAGDPVTRLLSEFIVSLFDTAPDMESTDTLAIEEAAIELLASGIARRDPEGTVGDPLLAQVLRRRMLEFIDSNLTEPDLGPALLMRRFRVSRAHLYRMFSSDGGVAKLVRERRLEAAYRELMRSASPSRPITEIAYDLGFSSSDQFLRGFRARFAMTPSDARERGLALAHADRSLSDVRAHFAEQTKWLDAEGRLHRV